MKEVGRVPVDGVERHSPPIGSVHAVIFDMDGTLTQTVEVDGECFEEAIKAVFDVPTVDVDWDSYEHVTGQGIIEELSLRERGVELTSIESENVVARFVELLKAQPASRMMALEGAVQFLELLQRRGVPVAIATGCWTESARYKLQMAGIAVSALPLSTSSHAISRQDIMLRARDELSVLHGGASFTRITYFGDSPWDVRACAELGWDLIGIGTQFEKLKALGTKHAFRDYTDMEEILEAVGIG